MSTPAQRQAAKLPNDVADRFLEALDALDREQPWTGFEDIDEHSVEYAWDESKHRRDPGGPGGGRFISKGTASALGIEAGARLPKHKPDLVTDDVDEAVEALAAGKRVELRQPREISTLLDKVAAYAREAEAKGGKVPDLDLCRVSVKGTNVFCAGTKGIPRLNMPQLKASNPVKGSKADKLPRDKRGEVDIMPHFIEDLRKRGITVTDRRESPAYLRASQVELNGEKVAGIFGALRSGVKMPGSIMVSRDNYVVDGHHRYAAELGIDAEDGVLGDQDMAVQQVDMPILQVLAEANRFAEEWGIPPQGFGAKIQYAVWDEREHPRDSEGRFRGSWLLFPDLEDFFTHPLPQGAGSLLVTKDQVAGIKDASASSDVVAPLIEAGRIRLDGTRLTVADREAGDTLTWWAREKLEAADLMGAEVEVEGRSAAVERHVHRIYRNLLRKLERAGYGGWEPGLVSYGWDPLEHPRDTAGRFTRSGQFEVGISPFRGPGLATLRDVVSFYSSPRYAAFQEGLEREAWESDVDIEELDFSAGLWEGKLEPSAVVSVKGDAGAVTRWAGTHARHFDQEAVAVFERDPNGDDVDVRVRGRAHEDDVLAAVEEHGLGGVSVTRDGFELWAPAGSVEEHKAEQAAVELGENYELIRGNLTFLTEGVNYGWDPREHPRHRSGKRGGQFRKAGVSVSGSGRALMDQLAEKYDVPKVGSERQRLVEQELGWPKGKEKRRDIQTMAELERALDPDVKMVEERVGGLTGEGGLIARIRDIAQYVAASLLAMGTTPYYRALAAATIAIFDFREKAGEKGEDPESLMDYYINTEHAVHYAMEHAEELGALAKGVAGAAGLAFEEEDEEDADSWAPV
jgi:hypothetical protein